MRNRATTPLSKAKVRQSWSKYNLYNLSRITPPSYRTATFFQQKWTAKSLLRNYHGEQIREAQWTKMFKRRLNAVVPMQPDYLARNDGTIESAGRGGGLKDDSGMDMASSFGKPRVPLPATPYMQMTFAPIERRLDSAIFRALFASSTRQARQFVVHGAVKVNGKKMKYPGYLLNPGDMFQVDPERVMFATGAPKEAAKSAKKSTEGDEGEQEAQPEPEPEPVVEEEFDQEKSPREMLKDLQSQAKNIIASQREKIGAKRKQDLRAFTKAIKRLLSRSSTSTILTDSLEAQFAELKNQLKIQRQNQVEKKTSVPSEQAKKDTNTEENPDKPLADAQLDAEEAEERKNDDPDASYLSNKELLELRDALQAATDNPIDPDKPYETPWRPRDYMSAFTFIPRYLEVNQNICSAVYLRHPVARPGLAEVPSPYGLETNSSAFVWYLRRR